MLDFGRYFVAADRLIALTCASSFCDSELNLLKLI
jgi:hypothetical protein